MGAPRADLNSRQRHIAETAACYAGLAGPLRHTLITTFSCSAKEAQDVVDETFLLMYERLEAGTVVVCPPVWLFGTATQQMRRRRRRRWLGLLSRVLQQLRG